MTRLPLGAWLLIFTLALVIGWGIAWVWIFS
jgi:hypothetical protein